MPPASIVVRIRPPPTGPEAHNVPPRFARSVLTALNKTTLQSESVVANAPKVMHTFDRVISQEEGQSDVYEEAKDLVDAFLSGINCTIFAYGQTASGKSYTMGTDHGSSGIIPRAVSTIFERTASPPPGTTYEAKLSYVELYNEDLIDLLGEEADHRPLVQIREDQGKIIWSGLREIAVTNAEEVME